MKAAIFDIDGVLTKDFAIADFWKGLADRNIINPVFVNENMRLFGLFREGKISYREMAVNGMKQIALAHKGVSQETIRTEAKNFFENNEIRYFNYSLPLINSLKERDLKIIAVSGSTSEFIERYKKTLGIDITYGTEFVVNNGQYTGEVKKHIGLEEEKRKVLEMLSSNGTKNVIGFGDSDQDIAILENVDIPIALNPVKELEKVAQERKWTILNEKDDVVEGVGQLI